MSILSTLAISAGANVADTLLLRSKRSISGPGFQIFPDVVIEERHLDELEITSHPVERGSPINDHAFKKPVELAMVLGFSNTTALSDLGKDIITGNFGQLVADSTGDALQDAYNNLQTIMNSLGLCDITTGKRTYHNMMLQRMAVVTNRQTENALIVEVVFREVIIVDTKATSLPPIAQQANPEKTADVVNSGTKILSGGESLLGSLPTPPPFIAQ